MTIPTRQDHARRRRQGDARRGDRPATPTPAIVYVTDAKAAGSTRHRGADPGVAERARDLPDRADRGVARTQDLADAWIKYVVSPAGQKTLQSFGFLPPPPAE